MTDKEVVCAIEPHVYIEKDECGAWLVRRYPGGWIIGSGETRAKAWYSARMRLFG